MDLNKMLILGGLMPFILDGILLLELKTYLSLHVQERGADVPTPH